MNLNVNPLIDAIGIIVDDKIRKAGYDKTVVAEVVDCTDNTNKLFTVRYQNAVYTNVFSYGNKMYSNGTLVYFTIPSNDDKLTKYILGPVSAEVERAVSIVGDELSLYTEKAAISIIPPSSVPIIPTGTSGPSGSSGSTNPLGPSGTVGPSGTINPSGPTGASGPNETPAIVNTLGPSRSSDISSPTGTVGPTVTTGTGSTVGPTGTSNIKKTIIFGPTGVVKEEMLKASTSFAENQYLQTAFEQYPYFIVEYDIKNNIQNTFAARGNFGFTFTLNFNNEAKKIYHPTAETETRASEEETTVEIEETYSREYKIDINNMTGQPYLFKGGSHQYMIFKIENSPAFYSMTNFKFFAENFSEGDKFILSNVRCYVAQKQGEEPIGSITEKESNEPTIHRTVYSLSLATTDRKEYLSNDHTQVNMGAVFKIDDVEINNNVSFYWGVADESVRYSDEGYCQDLGEGWRCLNEVENIETATSEVEFYQYVSTKSLMLDESNLPLYINKIKCVAVYNNEKIKSNNTLTIINHNSPLAYQIVLTSKVRNVDNTNKFSLNPSNWQENTSVQMLDYITVSCAVYKKPTTENEQPELETEGITYVWERLDSLGHKTSLPTGQNANRQEFYAYTIYNYTVVRCHIYKNTQYCGFQDITITNIDNKMRERLLAKTNIFNSLTNNGQYDGIYYANKKTRETVNSAALEETDPEDISLYINATAIESGHLAVPFKNEQGKYEEDSERPLRDEKGKIIPKKDESGNIIYQTDENGNQIKDEDGNPIPVPAGYEPKYLFYADIDDPQNTRIGGFTVLDSALYHNHDRVDITVEDKKIPGVYLGTDGLFVGDDRTGDNTNAGYIKAWQDTDKTWKFKVKGEIEATSLTLLGDAANDINTEFVTIPYPYTETIKSMDADGNFQEEGQKTVGILQKTYRRADVDEVGKDNTEAGDPNFDTTFRPKEGVKPVSQVVELYSDNNVILSNVGQGDSETFVSISKDGLLTANNAIIHGTIYANAGQIAGFTIQKLNNLSQLLAGTIDDKLFGKTQNQVILSPDGLKLGYYQDETTGQSYYNFEVNAQGDVVARSIDLSNKGVKLPPAELSEQDKETLETFQNFVDTWDSNLTKINEYITDAASVQNAIDQKDNTNIAFIYEYYIIPKVDTPDELKSENQSTEKTSSYTDIVVGWKEHAYLKANLIKLDEPKAVTIPNGINAELPEDNNKKLWNYYELKNGGDPTPLSTTIYVYGSDAVITNVGTGNKNTYFCVDKDGLLTAKNAIISGTIYANAGEIGGLTLRDNILEAGSDNYYVAIDGNEYNEVDQAHIYAMWTGNETPQNAPFSISKDGAVIATVGKISGLIMESYKKADTTITDLHTENNSFWIREEKDNTQKITASNMYVKEAFFDIITNSMKIQEKTKLNCSYIINSTTQNIKAKINIDKQELSSPFSYNCGLSLSNIDFSNYFNDLPVEITIGYPTAFINDHYITRYSSYSELTKLSSTGFPMFQFSPIYIYYTQDLQNRPVQHESNFSSLKIKIQDQQEISFSKEDIESLFVGTIYPKEITADGSLILPEKTGINCEGPFFIDGKNIENQVIYEHTITLLRTGDPNYFVSFNIYNNSAIAIGDGLEENEERLQALKDVLPSLPSNETHPRLQASGYIYRGEPVDLRTDIVTAIQYDAASKNIVILTGLAAGNVPVDSTNLTLNDSVHVIHSILVL